MIALDISQSMQIEDFTPNRLQAAKVVAQKFIEGRIQDRIGIVVFSGDAFSLAPLTTDYDLLKSYLKDISFEMIENRGTAIGSAIAVVTTAYIVTAIQFEERDLVAEHPGSYEGYRRRVPMLVPGSGGRRTSEAGTEQIPVVARD